MKNIFKIFSITTVSLFIALFFLQVNSVSAQGLDPALHCPVGATFDSITGVLCAPQGDTTQGCLVRAIYNFITGARCAKVESQASITFTPQKPYYISSVYFKGSYSEGELISFKNLQGTEIQNGKELFTPEEGFNVQAYIDVNELNSKGSLTGINGEYNPSLNTWRGSFSEKLKAGTYILNLILYCSDHTKSCFTTYGDSYQAVAKVPFTVGNPTTPVIPSIPVPYPTYTPNPTLPIPNYSVIDRSKDNFGAIRFTSPSSGSYSIQASLAPILEGNQSQDSDFHIVKNASEVYAKNLRPNEKRNYSETFDLKEGDTLDFLVGRGPDGKSWGTGLVIDLTITARIDGGIKVFSLGEQFPTQSFRRPWSLGYLPSLKENFIPFTNAYRVPDENGLQIDSWSVTASEQPSIYWNGNNRIAHANGGKSTFPSRSVWFTPGLEEGFVWDDPGQNDTTTSGFHLILPNGKENLKTGDKFTIVWDTGRFSQNENVKIELGYMHNDPTYAAGRSFLDFIAEGVRNRGSYVWKIPEYYSTNVVPSSFYVKITDATGASDVSDNNFTILPGSENTNLKVKSPVSGEKYSAGQQVPIIWSPRSDEGYGFTLLRKNDTSFGRLFFADYVDGKNVWTVPSDVPKGDDYFIKVTEGPSRSMTGYSGTFSINSSDFVRSSVRVIYPNDAQEWSIGNTYTVSFVTPSTNDSALIYLERGYPAGSSKKGVNSSMLIGQADPGHQSFTYTVPETIASWPGLGNNYKIKVCMDNRCSSSDTSDSYFSITNSKNNSRSNVDLKVNGSDNPTAVAYNSIIEVAWGTTGFNIDSTRCTASGHHVPTVDGQFWTDLTSLSSNGVIKLYAKHASYGYVSPLTISMQCSDGTKDYTDTVSIPVTQTNQPSIIYLSPMSGPVGTRITIAGSGFGSSNTILFAGNTYSPYPTDGRTIIFTVPKDISNGSYGLSVVDSANLTQGKNSNTIVFTVTSSNPTYDDKCSSGSYSSVVTGKPCVPPTKALVSVNVTYPNGREKWDKNGSNQIQVVKWNTRNVPYTNNMTVRLRSVATGQEFLSSNNPNTGYAVVNVPSDFAEGKYKAEVKTAVDGQSYLDESDDSFLITSSEVTKETSERVKCVFNGAENEQKCYTATNTNASDWFTCSGIGSCVVDVKGPKSTALTWKSSCGGYAYTTIDGTNEYLNFSECNSGIKYPTTLLKVCPSIKIINKMPTAVSEASYKNYFSSYFILDGIRRELSEFDLTWVGKNCKVAEQVVY